MTLLDRVIVSVASIDAALGFYRDVLGLDLAADPGSGLARLRGGGVEVLLHERPSRPSDLAVALSFRVSDLEGICAAWLATGGTVVEAPALQPWGERLAMVRDPDGHLVCLAA